MSERNLHSRPAPPRQVSAKWLIIVGIILIAFWLRLAHIDTFSFWTDEGITTLRTGYSLPKILRNVVTIQKVHTTDTHPPLFYVVVHYTRQLWGESDFAFRFPSAVFGVLLVPLLFVFGGRLFRSRTTGYLAAGLTAVNPLLIWYANEARMYTLLLLLITTATFILWQAMQETTARPQDRSGFGRSLALYILFAGLAFYTHYTAAFIILVQAPFWIRLLWRRGHKRLLLLGAAAGLLISLPLLPTMLPRLFNGWEANFNFVTPATMIYDLFRFFHLGLTVDYQAPLMILLVVWGGVMILLGIRALPDVPTRLLLPAVMSAALMGLMLGTILIKPMYQGARHIMSGSPMFILLLSGGIMHLRPRRRAISQTVLHGLLILTAFSGPAIALTNQFHDSRFAKDDYRQMVDYITANAGAQDVVVYNDAVLLALHDHYAPPDAPLSTAVPRYGRLANPEIIPNLQELADSYDRIWFITNPPADFRDEEHFVEGWLDENLALTRNILFPARTIELRLKLYTSQPHAVADLPADAAALNLRWSDNLQLRGARISSPQPVRSTAVWFDLYWEGAAPTAANGIRFALQGADGAAWWADGEALLLSGTGRLAGRRPRSGKRTTSRLPAGTPPGSYEILVRPVHLCRYWMCSWVIWKLPDRQCHHCPYAGGFARAGGHSPSPAACRCGWSPPPVSCVPGSTLPLTLFWQTGAQSQSSLVYQLDVVDDAGRSLRSISAPPGAPWMTHWEPRLLLREKTGLYFPPDFPPGKIPTALAAVLPTESRCPAARASVPESREVVTYSTVQVDPWPLVRELPADITAVNAAFGDAILLAGYQAAETATAIDLQLVWRATAVPTRDTSPSFTLPTPPATSSPKAITCR
jgi:mannosyltransferase